MLHKQHQTIPNDNKTVQTYTGETGKNEMPEIAEIDEAIATRYFVDSMYLSFGTFSL